MAAVGLLAAACSSSTPTAKKSSSSTTFPVVTTTTAAPGATSTTTSTTAASGKSTVTTAAPAKSNTSPSSSSCTTTLSSACDTKDASGSLDGAGSTFDQPLFSRAFYTYSQDNSAVSVSYASVGSGAGITDTENKTVNFGASDVPLPAGCGGATACTSIVSELLQVPVALGGVAMAYNIPGIGQGLKLTGTDIYDIYAGIDTNWNQLTDTGQSMPNHTITTVHRSDSSGTSFIFTNYLYDINNAWNSSSCPGVSKSPTWTEGCGASAPSNIGGNGNPGVAADVANTQYSIGYVELAYALQGNITYAQVQNQAGTYQYPTLATVSAAAAQFPNINPSSSAFSGFSIDDAPGSGSYPIAGYSWALIYQNQTNQAQAIAVGKLFDWETSTGQGQASAIGYAPLPSNIQALAHSTLLKMEYNGKALFS